MNYHYSKSTVIKILMDNRFTKTIANYLDGKVKLYLENDSATCNNFIKSVINGDVEMVKILLQFNRFSPYESSLLNNGKMGVVVAMSNNFEIIKIYSNYGLLINMKDLKKMNKQLLITDSVYRKILSMV